MTEVFVIRNQLGHYWGKSKAWVDGSQPRQVLRSRHRDEAVNTLFELSSKDIELRGEVLPAELSERGEPMIAPSQNPLPEDPTTESPDQPAAAGAGDASDLQGDSPQAGDAPVNPAT